MPIMLRTIGMCCVFLAACATAPKPPTKAGATSARQPDTAAEKTAALRANDPNAHSEDEARRWGIEENKVRKEEKRPAKKTQPVKQAPAGGGQPAAPPSSPPAPPAP
jgi:hypothetical protein